MKKSALNFGTEELPVFIEATRQTQPPPASTIVAYPPPVSSPALAATALARGRRARSKKLIRFIKLEAVALFFLVLTLAGVTSKPFIEAGLSSLFEIAMMSSALAVAIIPVIFYGSTREKYQYRSRRNRAR
jgi:hypothetical protein